MFNENDPRVQENIIKYKLGHSHGGPPWPDSFYYLVDTQVSTGIVVSEGEWHCGRVCCGRMMTAVVFVGAKNVQKGTHLRQEIIK